VGVKPTTLPAYTAEHRPDQGGDRRLGKKQATKDALIRAAMELFQAKGYDRTAIHEITLAVDVSQRTSFRYFASKEDLALSFVQDRMTMFARALATRDCLGRDTQHPEAVSAAFDSYAAELPQALSGCWTANR
jgi:AcrR family transcriptional regulator